jgi:hypothetical protein
MEAALAWRRRAFLAWGIPTLLLALSVDSLGAFQDSESDPDLATAAAWAVIAVYLLIIIRAFFVEPQIRKIQSRIAQRRGSSSTEEVGKMLNLLAASVLSVPTIVGLLLVSMSGDAWRFYIFLPISIVGGFVLWHRIEELLARLEVSGSAAGSDETVKPSLDEAVLRSPWIFGVMTTVALFFVGPQLGVSGTGQQSSTVEVIGLVGLVVSAIVLVLALPRLLHRHAHQVVLLRTVTAALPFLVSAIATRFGAPQWPPGISLVVFVILLVHTLQSGRQSLPTSQSGSR